MGSFNKQVVVGGINGRVFNRFGRAWLCGAVAAAALVAAPMPFSPLAPAAHAGTYDERVQQVADADRELIDEDARFNAEIAGKSKGTLSYKAAVKVHEQNVKEIKARRSRLQDQALNAKLKVTGESAEKKIGNIGDKILDENKRHADAMKRIPNGSAAEQEEIKRHEDILAELRDRRDDLRDVRQDARETKQSTLDYKRDTKAIAAAVDAENRRHAKAMKFMPANSKQAREEVAYHAEMLQAAQEGRSAAADRRDDRLSNIGGDR
jgi:hypothetical protein